MLGNDGMFRYREQSLKSLSLAYKLDIVKQVLVPHCGESVAYSACFDNIVSIQQSEDSMKKFGRYTL